MVRSEWWSCSADVMVTPRTVGVSKGPTKTCSEQSGANMADTGHQLQSRPFPRLLCLSLLSTLYGKEVERGEKRCV